ncbi:putative RNA-directed DNA polymerase [Helianthus annuus]|nr:putative RNA-directed DNA polymerase [Helianthus annuus]
MATTVTQVAEETLGVTTGLTSGHKDTWWWSEDVQIKIRDKQGSFRDLLRYTVEEERLRLKERYKKAKREAKKAVVEAKNRAYKNMYERLETKEGEHAMFRIAKARERRKQDLGVVKFIKGEDGHVLVKELDIKLRWQTYFSNLFNGGREVQQESDDNNTQGRQRNNCYCRSITMGEIRTALKKMGRAKAVGPDNIPIEVWKCLGEDGVRWLATLFNLIFIYGKIPEQWRSSDVVPLYKNKGDAQCCGNYRGIKLLSHTMKLWERVIETRIRKETQVTVNQFGFMPGRSTTEAIHILRRLMEKYREKRRDLHMVFIDLEKAYDRVPRRLIWESLEGRGVPGKYIDLIRDMYDRTVTRVRVPVGDTESFPVEVGLHQGSALSPFLFAIVLDELSKSIQETVPWCMLFADDIMLVAETRQTLNARLEEWRAALEGNGLRISRSKTEYLYCNFSGAGDNEDTQVTIEGQVVLQTTKFKYLGSFVQSDGEIDSDVSHRIQVGWCRWRAATGILCDRRFPTKLKGKIYRVAVRPAMLYGTDCWAIKKTQARKMEVAEMRMLRWMCGHTMLDRIRSEVFRDWLRVYQTS